MTAVDHDGHSSYCGWLFIHDHHMLFQPRETDSKKHGFFSYCIFFLSLLRWIELSRTTEIRLTCLSGLVWGKFQEKRPTPCRKPVIIFVLPQKISIQVYNCTRASAYQKNIPNKQAVCWRVNSRTDLVWPSPKMKQLKYMLIPVYIYWYVYIYFENKLSFIRYFIFKN